MSRPLRSVLGKASCLTLRPAFLSDFHVRNPQITVYTPDASKAADIDRADLSAKGYTTMMSVLDVRPPVPPFAR